MGSRSKQAETRYKPIGQYLVDSGLLTQPQIEVALKDQSLTSLKFGDIVSARGWVKPQTIEYLMAKIIMPERNQILHRDLSVSMARQPPKRDIGRSNAPKSPAQRDAEQGINWVG